MILLIVICFIILIFVIINIKKISLKILEKSGWKSPPERLMEIMKKYKRLVIVYPHTSHLDGTLMILYKKAYPEFGENIKFLIRPDIVEFPILGSFLIKNGAVPSTLISIKNGGRTKEIVNYLNSLNQFQLLISPKGTIRNSPWKKGYYYITKGTNAHVMAIGLDYSTGNIIFNEPYPISGHSDNFPSEEFLSYFLKSQLKSIPQRNPSFVEY